METEHWDTQKLVAENDNIQHQITTDRLLNMQD